MDSMFVYRKIGNHLKSIYRVDPHDADQVNLVKCRAVTLTHLHHLLSEHSSNSFVSASYRDSLYELYIQQPKLRLRTPLPFIRLLFCTFLKMSLLI